LTLSNGSEVRAVPASEAAVRGWTADVLLVDEAQLVADDLLLSGAFPTVAASGGPILLAGTCGRAEGAFYDVCRQADTGATGMPYSRRVSRLVGGDEPTPWLSATMVAQLERAMGPVRADVELRCLWATGSDYLFGAQELDAITAHFRADALDGVRGPPGVFGGLDLGLRCDRSAFVAVGRVALPGGGEPRFAVRCAHPWPSGYPLMSPESSAGRAAFEELAGSPAVLQSLRVDATGVSGGLLQALAPMIRARLAELGGGAPSRRLVAVDAFEDWDAAVRALRRSGAASATDVRGISFSLPMKQASYGALRMLVERGQLLLPASATELRRELLTVQVGLGRSGVETFDAESGGFDDLPDALVLSLRPYRRRDGQWRTVVGDFAEDPSPRVELPDEVWEPGVVSTGAGLELPAVPVWASMQGHVTRELTFPLVDGVPLGGPGWSEWAAAARRRSEAERRRERVWNLIREQEAAHADG
jgi:hypothetical protein